MLDPDEQRTWDEIRRRYLEEARQPARPVLGQTVGRPRPPGPVGLLVAAVGGSCLAVLLVVLGAPVAGLAFAVAAVPRWLLWRYGSSLDGIVGQPAPTAVRDLPLDTGTGRPPRPEAGSA